MKLLRRLIAIGMVAVIVFSNSTTVYAADNSQTIIVEEVGIQEAENAVVMHIQSVMSIDEKSPWNDGVKIGSRKAIFDVNEEISAYYFGLVDINEKPCGYVITSADTAGYPILEFAEEGESFIDNAMETTSDSVKKECKRQVKDRGSKVYYIGGASYAIEHTLEDGEKVMYDVTTSNVSKIDKKTIKKAKDKKRKGKDNKLLDYTSNWELYKRSGAYGASNPPNRKGEGYIISPEQYESGYANDAKPYTVKGGEQKCFILKDFANYGVCSPTAAINLCRYWYRRDKDKYSALCKNGSWTYSFWLMYGFMKTTEKNGTYDRNMPVAFELYFEECGLSCKSVLHTYTNNGRFIVDELKQDRPCLINVSDHYYYGNHTMFAVGYKEFVYNKWYGKSYSTYIRVADGWEPYPNRYVWGGCTGDWSYVTVIPD